MLVNADSLLLFDGSQIANEHSEVRLLVALALAQLTPSQQSITLAELVGDRLQLDGLVDESCLLLRRRVVER